MKTAIVRVFDQQHQVVGIGWLVTADYVLTCAHVIARALGLPSTTATLPSHSMLDVDFPLVQSGTYLRAEISFWLPARQSGQGEMLDDVAALHVVDPLPTACQPAPLADSTDCWGDPFKVYGCPRGSDAGAWAAGVIREATASGWYQIEGTRQEGFRVGPGFSGGPVWNDRLEGVVGMVVASDLITEQKTAYMIPVTEVQRVWELMPIPPVPPSPPLLAAVDAVHSLESPLVVKLRLGGASGSTIGDAIQLRAFASEHEQKRLSSSLGTKDAYLDDLRERLRIQANAIAGKYRDRPAPADLIWDDLLRLLTEQPSQFDRYRLFDQDPMLLLGEVCELSDECKVRWGA